MRRGTTGAIACALLVACTPRGTGTDDDGAPVAPVLPVVAPALVWVDATGAVIGEDLVVLDSFGRIFNVDPETGRVRAGTAITMPVMYEDETCSGPALTSVVVTPRRAVEVLGVGYVFRPDTAEPATPRVMRSRDGPDGGCTVLDVESVAVAVERGVYVQTGGEPPTTGWAPPLRQELR